MLAPFESVSPNSPDSNEASARRYGGEFPTLRRPGIDLGCAILPAVDNGDADRDAADAPRGEQERALAAAIGPLGVWDAGLCYAPARVARAAASELEHAGYGAAWLHEGGGDAFAVAGVLLAATRRLVLGTSIASIWRHEPGQMAAAARTLGEAYPGRFVLGIGPAHEGAGSWHGRRYARPLSDLAEYMDAMEAAPWGGPRPDPPVPRVISALGPRMLDLARRRSRGAIPYLVPVAHTRYARERLGPEPVLAVEQAIVLGETDEDAQALARAHVAGYLGAVNYRNNLLRCGFSEHDVAGEGSDELVQGLVAWGDKTAVAARVREHLDAGADHVCVQPLRDDYVSIPVAELSALAELLG